MAELHSKLKDKTLSLLIDRPNSLKLETIANDTKISIHWLRKFVSDKIADPSVCRIEPLYEYLSKTTIQL